MNVLFYHQKRILKKLGVLGGLKIFFLILLLSSSAQAREKFLDIQKITSPGGISAWLVEDHNLPIIALQFAFKEAGSALDPKDKQGLARMLSNTMDEGAGEYDSQAFQKALADHSITVSFSSNRDNFYGSLKTLTRHKDLALTLMNLALTQPRFDIEPVERMRAANIARIRSSLANPNWIAARLMNDLAYGKHPYAMNSGGTLTTLNNITPDDLRNFKQSYLTKDRLLVSVTGDITAEEMGAVLDNMFGALPAKGNDSDVADTVIQNGGEILHYRKDIPQTIMQITQPGIDRKDPDWYAATIMNFILGSSGFGSRLTDEIREKRGLVYGIYTGLSTMDHLNALSLSTSTQNNTAGEVLSLIKEEWNKMKNRPVTDREIKTAKSYLVGSMPLSLSSTGSIAGMVLGLRLDDLPIDYLDQYAGKIESVTVDDIKNIAGKLLTPDSLTIVVVGQPEGITPTRTTDTLPNVD